MGQLKIDGTGHGKPVMPFGSDGTDWYALLIDALGHLQVDVVSAALGSGGATEATLLLIKGYVDTLETLLAGGLPAALDTGALKTKEQSPLTGFATSANQATMITALQLIDDLRNALGSVATDKVLVASKSGDKLFGFESIVEAQLANTALAAGTNALAGASVGAGKIWKITQCGIMYSGTVPASMVVYVNGLAVYLFLLDQKSPVSNQWYMWNGEVYLQVGDFMEAVVYGATLNDAFFFRYAGVQMNAP